MHANIAMTEMLPISNAAPSEKETDGVENKDGVSKRISVNEPKSIKILRGWHEIAEKAAAGDGAVLGFLKIAKVFIENNTKVYIKFPNDFAKSMVEAARLRDSLRASISMATKLSLRDEDLIFDVMEDNEEVSELDEFVIFD